MVGVEVGALVGEDVGALVGAAVGIDTHTVAPCRSAVHSPVAHASQTSYTPASWYRPDGQWSQLVCLTIAAILPASQPVHALPVVA